MHHHRHIFKTPILRLYFLNDDEVPGRLRLAKCASNPRLCLAYGDYAAAAAAIALIVWIQAQNVFQTNKRLVYPKFQGLAE